MNQKLKTCKQLITIETTHYKFFVFFSYPYHFPHSILVETQKVLKTLLVLDRNITKNYRD